MTGQNVFYTVNIYSKTIKMLHIFCLDFFLYSHSELACYLISNDLYSSYHAGWIYMFFVVC